MQPHSDVISAPHSAAPARARSALTDHDVYLFREGSHSRLYEKLGCHFLTADDRDGAQFAVWAPNARSVSVVGDFNGWDSTALQLSPRPDGSGIWEGHAPRIAQGDAYKFLVVSPSGHGTYKGDPFAFYWEVPPRTAARAWRLDYEWNDAEWMRDRGARNALDAPISIYEVHLGSWRRGAHGEQLDYREMARQLAEHAKRMGYTHVEILPVTEHPFYGSWGYQTTGYFAPTSRYGSPQDFMHLVDTLHQNGIGVILDWVPSHFPNDEHGLGYFDGAHVFEHADPRQGFHPDWNSFIFNYGRNEVRSFLLSNAMYWLSEYHIDGLRVDAVASMLYLDYSRKAGEWIPNEYGGRENLGAISLLRRFNAECYGRHPDVQTIAEESTAWPMVSRPTHIGGLGFGLKWDMGWMHDTLKYMHEDPIHRKYHYGEITFRMVYAFHENFVLPLSHDEVVHGKGSLLDKMPGDEWQKFANLRLLYGYMYGQPGKKLLFMGAEIAQWREWKHDESLDWHLLQHAPHAGVHRLLEDLNRMYRSEPGLHQLDCSADGFEWIDCTDWENSVVSFLRKGRNAKDTIAVVCNFTPVPRHNYRIGVPEGGLWKEIFNSDAAEYGGSGVGNMGGVEALPLPAHGRYHSLNLTLPPLAATFLKRAD